MLAETPKGKQELQSSLQRVKTHMHLYLYDAYMHAYMYMYSVILGDT